MTYSDSFNTALDVLGEEQCARLLKFVAIAAPPRERADANYFVAADVQDPAEIERRKTRWRQAVGAGFIELQALGDSRFPGWNLDEGMQDVVVRNPEYLPDWARMFCEFMTQYKLATACEECDDSANSSIKGFRRLQRLFRKTGQLLLIPAIPELEFTVSSEVVDQLTRQLANRLMTAVSSTIEFEWQVHRVFVDFDDRIEIDLSIEGWMERLELLPGLAYVIGILCQNWLESTQEFLGRLAQDWNVLVQEFWNGVHPGALADFRGDAGDPHDGGRGVGILTFDSGAKLVYKTKRLHGAKVFNDLIGFLNQSGLDLELPVRRILTRDHHGWEEFVPENPCTDPEQIGRFYQRMGMLLRLLQLVDGRDFWLDNLVANGEFPNFIDIETLCSARLSGRRHQSSVDNSICELIEDSVVATAAVAAPVMIGVGQRFEDMGALTSFREFRTPFKSQLTAIRSESAERKDEQGYVKWSPPPFSPRLGDQHVNVSSFVDRLVDGYRQMQECLVANRDVLLDEQSAIGSLSGCFVRHIVRDTWSCYSIMQASLMPTALSDGVSRDIELSKMYRQLAETPQAFAKASVLRSEIDSIRNLDVPLFLSLPGNDSIYTSQGDEFAGYFSGSAAERIRVRLEQIEAFDIREHEALLLSCLGTGSIGSLGIPRQSLPNTGFHLQTGSGNRDQWLEQAVQIGDSIIGLARNGSAGEIGWLGVSYDPWHDLHWLGPLGADLISGTSGLAIVLADLFSLTGESRFREIVDRIINTNLASPEQFRSRLEETSRGGVGRLRPGTCGAFLGIGSAIYTLNRCAAALGDARLSELAGKFASSIRENDLQPESSLDVISGMAGLLLTLPPSTGNDPLGTAAIGGQLLDWISRQLEPGRPVPVSLYPAKSQVLGQLPGFMDGIFMTLCRHDLSVALRVRETHPDRTSESSTPGSLLAQLDHGMGTDQLGLRRSIHRLIERDPDQMSLTEVLDAIELATTVFEVDGDPACFDQASRLTNYFIDQYRATGSWFSDRHFSDSHNLSAIGGVPAILHALTRLVAPGEIKSIRLLK